ncbi:hypothetical protein [Gluconacetobacter asukensis]|uniref:Uncharacterized protein n=1 Tax=Gluconacetobacter asukensis TaxID=1017181 RepID=A0A7W4J1I9_9PROT|nr:hypothetical protein [Gluconacetobacter asukensis]MBB2172941.1 hypothetical protein [Gluconacetobacter asukensis]
MDHISNVINADTKADLDSRVEQLIAAMTPDGYRGLTRKLEDHFGLRFAEVPSHPFNIKAMIKGKDIVFSESVSLTSRAFMMLHSLGHYYFICEAKRKNVERYSYIYDLRGVQAALHYYETEGQANGLEAPPEMTEQKRKDRVSFEIGANNFAIDLMRTLGLENVGPIVRAYEVGDINYIVDVSGRGKSAITKTDREYLEKYICGDLSVDPDDMYDDGVYSSGSFDVDAIDWRYLEDIKLEIHFF